MKLNFKWTKIVKALLIALLVVNLGGWLVWFRFPERVLAKEVTKQVIPTTDTVLNLYGLDWIPPKVLIKNPAKALNFIDTEFSIFSNEPVVHNTLPTGWNLVFLGKYNNQYDYLLQTNDIPDGEHDYDLKFEDAAGNSLTRKVHLIAKAKRPDTTGWKDTQYFIDGDSLTALVNKEYRLPEDYEPTDLINLTDVGVINSNASRVRSIIVASLLEMVKAMKAAGVNYVVSSGYRSFLTQYGTYNYWIDYYHGDVSKADEISARPGYSEHQLGTTMDIVTGENGYVFDGYETTKLAKWLDANAYKYGFIMSYPKDKESITGYAHEGWHYRYIGVENAAKVKQSGLTLIEWLKQYNGVK
jgi:D-alanyl-D-alanine carboxypeptidase